MTYNLNKFFLAQTESNPSTQNISTSYVELTGSKCEIKSVNPNPTLVYKYTFYTMVDLTDYPNSKKPHLNIKLQKSNDNFSSNIVDVVGQNFSISGDTYNDSEAYYKASSCFFIVEDFDSQFLRVVARSYSSTTKSQLHTSEHYDGSTSSNVKYNPSLLVIEV
tara:strand:+ start:15975 stop:16463 length:489 start_codon:yes stop_codon:yes gene_type:complete